MQKTIVVSTCILLVISSVYIMASPAAELGKWWKNSKIVEALNLSNPQVERIENDYLDHRETLADLLRDLELLEEQLNSYMQAVSLNETAILEYSESVAEARKELEIEKARMMLSIRKQLTVEQWKRLQSMQQMEGLPIQHESIVNGLKYMPQNEIEALRKNTKLVGPILVYKSKPAYTPEAKSAKVSGIVVLEGLVHKDGTIGQIKVLRSLGYGLDESAVNTVTGEWRFSPATLDGVPVEREITIEISFGLY